MALLGAVASVTGCIPAGDGAALVSSTSMNSTPSSVNDVRPCGSIGDDSWRTGRMVWMSLYGPVAAAMGVTCVGASSGLWPEVAAR